MSDLKAAVRRHHMWFGSHTRAGELKKVHVWCFLHDGNIEFMTPGDSLKAKRAARNPRVVCNLASENGPQISGAAEIVRDPADLWRGYRAYWKTHPVMMLILSFVIRKQITTGRQIMIRVRPDAPNPLASITDIQN
jgi:hypothetical protein